MRTCTICRHSSRKEIEKALVSGTSLRNIAQQFLCSATAVHRHKAHIRQAVKDVQVTRFNEDALTVVEHLAWLRKEAHELYYDARVGEMPDPRLALSALGHLLKQDEIRAEIEGELNRGPHIDIHQDPQWVNMRELIFRALQPYPEALRAVAEALWKEGQNGSRISA